VTGALVTRSFTPAESKAVIHTLNQSVELLPSDADFGSASGLA